MRDTDQLEKTMTNIFSMEMNGMLLKLRSCEILAARYVLQCGYTNLFYSYTIFTLETFQTHCVWPCTHLLHVFFSTPGENMGKIQMLCIVIITLLNCQVNFHKKYNIINYPASLSHLLCSGESLTMKSWLLFTFWPLSESHLHCLKSSC